MRLKNIGLLFCMVLALAASAAPLRARAQQTGGETPPEHVRITAIPEMTAVSAGMPLMVAIREELDDGWHVYWRNPGDSGVPASFDWHMPQGFETGELYWPVPKRIPYGPLTNYGYENEVTLVQTLDIPRTLPAGPLEISADVDILVCKEICIPEYHKISFTLNNGADENHSDVISAAFDKTPVAVNWDAGYYTNAQGDFVVDLSLDTPGLIGDAGKPVRFDLLPYEWGVINNNARTSVRLTAPGKGQHLLLVKKRGDRPLDRLGNLTMLVTYASDGVAARAIEITAHPSPPQAGLAAAAPGKQAGSSGPAASTVSGQDGISYITALLFALVGGLILNLMPCVFPILSIKALSLARLNEKTPGAARAHGIAYTAGILVCFGVIAALLIALKGAGAQIGWGFQLQNPVVVLLLSYLLFVVGLNLSGFFEMAGGFGNIGGSLSAKQGLTGDFFTGVLATLVATPCTAPFMGVAMGFALTQPAPVAITVFLALGFGLALPYLVLSFVPALRASLPKPGPWMAVFRELLAFPMYASAVWLIWVYSMQTGATGLLSAMAGFVGISFAIWIFRYAPREGAGRLALRGLALVVLLTVLTIAVGESMHKEAATSAATATAASAESGQAQPFTTERYTALLRGDDPLFVNMTAAWCITCKVNERVALDTDATRALFAKYKVAYLKGDWTNQDPVITAYLARYGRNGVPLYVFYGARDPQTGKRPDAVILPQLLTKGIIAETFGGKRE